MIPRIEPKLQYTSWQQELADSVRDIEELASLLGLSIADIPRSRLAQEDFPLRVPKSFIRRMRPGNLQDPLLLQVLPRPDELEHVVGYTADPVGDMAARKDQGVLQKYHGRQLIVTTGACAVHCRYCFRRHYPYAESRASHNDWQGTLSLISDNPSIHEIILSGGDPLSLNDDKLSTFARQLEHIPHVRTLRIHSRLPVVLPSRIDEQFLDWFSATPLQKVFVLHINHPQEINRELEKAITHLRHTGATLLNQSVLLAGVNDDATVLERLSFDLFRVGILPYYLHVLDKVKGAAHFDVGPQTALKLHHQLQQQLPGYLVPRLVREQAGKLSKTPLL